ncbi:MAG: hypothetical protein COA96_12490 [SAR86 cluster bacterium]|uniref:DUF481 domain-containing protein n=1 Tax=SAR86 cluster bacterium TaxID=2030880 RepID=A0A2A5AWM9_9GAMM|nr:MAG: hypothetical protein COA96_12490 [SAR86 cluster bacterium]
MQSSVDANTPLLMALKLIALLSLLAGGPIFADTFSQLSLSVGDESNLPRGLDSQHEKSSIFTTVEYSLGKFYEVGLKNSITISGQLGFTKFNELSRFDRASYGASASYSYKLGLGAYAARLGTNLSISHDELTGEARDRDLVTLEFNYQKRLSPSWFVITGIDYQSSRSESLPDDATLSSFGYAPVDRLSYELFDYDSFSAFAELEYAFENGVLVSGGYRRINGHTVSSTTLPTHALYNISKAVYVDPAFRAGWLAYLLEANTNEWSVGASIPTGIDSSINIGYGFYDISGPSGRDYENRIVSISFVHNF